MKSQKLYESKDAIDLSELIDCFARAGSKVAVRRYVLICDLLEISNSYHESLLQNNVFDSVSVLDTSGPDEGKINSRYKLKINRDTDTIKQSIFT